MSGSLRAAQVLWDATTVASSGYADKATVDVGPAVTNGHLVLTADTGGAAGNNITISIVDDTTLTIAVLNNHGNGVVDIVVHINTTVTSTKNVADAINGNGTAAALVDATYNGTGAAKILAVSETHLAGGANTGVSSHPSASSSAANLGPQTAFAVFLSSSGAATFRVEASANHIPGVARNAIPLTDGTDEANWYSYARADAAELVSGAIIANNLDEIVFSGAGSVCIDLSPFAPTFLRLRRVDNAIGTRTVTAHVVSVG